MYILGLNAYHADSSACLLKNGEIVAATEEERFTRTKHWAGFPARAIQFCLDSAGIEMDQVAHVAIGRDPKAKLFEKIRYTLRNKISFSDIRERYKNQREVSSLSRQLADAVGADVSKVKARIHNIEHHRSHMGSTFFASPFSEAAILTLDGSGDFTTTMRGFGSGNQIKVLDSISYPVSIGLFYTAFTQFLGFPYYGDEYKVMGLAPYGSPKYVENVRKLIRFKKNGLFDWDPAYFRNDREGLPIKYENNMPVVLPLYSRKFEEEFGQPRQKSDPLDQFHKDLAASVQVVTEEIIFHLLNDLYQKTRLTNICIAGGVAQNSVANGKILANTHFENIYIPSAGHDAGNAMGSALYLYNHILQQPRNGAVYTAYTGAGFTNEYVEKALKAADVPYNKLDDTELFEYVAGKLVEGNVVGWFQGRAEFGPRALGARSILMDPRHQDAKDLLNLKIKRRESFRPFAPSILKEYVAEYFEHVDDVPFMEKVLPIRSEKRAVIPAVTHVDGSGRLQTVDKKVAPRYYSLIEAFYQKSGVPILLNTSFNENEPIVNKPEEALDCYLRTQMDVLVLENCVIERN